MEWWSPSGVLANCYSKGSKITEAAALGWISSTPSPTHYKQGHIWDQTRLGLEPDTDGDCTTSPGSLVQCQAVLSEISFLICNWNLFFQLMILPLLPCAVGKSPSQLLNNPPGRQSQDVVRPSWSCLSFTLSKPSSLHLCSQGKCSSSDHPNDLHWTSASLSVSYGPGFYRNNCRNKVMNLCCLLHVFIPFLSLAIHWANLSPPLRKQNLLSKI